MSLIYVDLILKTSKPSKVGKRIKKKIYCAIGRKLLWSRIVQSNGYVNEVQMVKKQTKTVYSVSLLVLGKEGRCKGELRVVVSNFTNIQLVKKLVKKCSWSSWSKSVVGQKLFSFHKYRMSKVPLPRLLFMREPLKISGLSHVKLSGNNFWISYKFVMRMFAMKKKKDLEFYA